MRSEDIRTELNTHNPEDGNHNAEAPRRDSKGEGSSRLVAVLTPELNIGPLDTRSRSAKFIVGVGGERHYEVSDLVYQMMRLINGRRTDDEIADCLRKRHFADLNGMTVRKIIDDYFMPRGFVLMPGNITKGQKLQGFLRMRLSLFSQEELRPITNLLRILFNRQIFASLFVSAIIQIYLALSLKVDFGVIGKVSGFQLALVYFIVLLTSFIHELGHSSACAYFGARHGDIGIGVYLFFPVLYSDVSDIWRLDRRSRVMVDAGGIYFQFLSVTVLYLLYMLFPIRVLVASIFATYLAIVTAVNPFLKFDGYWILSDLLGIPNLGKRSIGTLRVLWNAMTGRKGAGAASVKTLKTESALASIIYGVLSCLFLVLLLYQVIFFLNLYVQRVVIEVNLLSNVATGTSLTDIFSRIIDLLSAAIPVALLAIPLFAWIIRLIRRFSGSSQALQKQTSS